MSSLMKGRPIKFRLLEYMHENGTKWNYEIIPDIMADYNLTGDYYRDCINYDLIELAASGFLKAEQSIVDTEGIFRKNRAIFEYSLTDLGEQQYNWLVNNIKKGEVNE